MHSPYRHSVWWDVAAVVFMLALLLLPIGVLVTEFGGGIGVGGGVASARSPAPRTGPGSVFSSQAHSQARQRTGSLSGESPARSMPSRRHVPFSQSWRAEAMPDLSVGGTSPGPTGRASEGMILRGGEAGPSVASREGAFQSGTLGGGVTGGGSGTEWRTEARRLAGRARALSNQLGQMDRATTSEQRGSSGARTSESRRAASRTSADNPGLPGQPTVPIDDHLHWLLVAGVLWGAWRLHRG